MEVQLPGFRFHPTEQELLNFYLRSAVNAKKLSSDIIGFLNIYQHDPWELPGKAREGQGEREWYFYVARNRKHGGGNGKANRTTGNGFWKATGSDRPIRSNSPSEGKKVLGMKKTLVFYQGRAPRGRRTDWVMNEFRLSDTTCLFKEDVVLCKVYRKATSFKELEQKSLNEEQGYAAASPTPVSGGDRLGGYGVPLNDFESTFFHVPTISSDQESNHDNTQKFSALCTKHGFVQQEDALSEEVNSLGNLFQVRDNWSLYAMY